VPARDDLDDVLSGARTAHRRLSEIIAGLSEAEARGPSALPGWSRGHLLTHLARNAESHVRIFAVAARGEVGHQYPGGDEQREDDIASGAGRPVGELLSDVERTAAALERAWGVSDWEGRGVTGSGEVELRILPMMRWREVAVHSIDLDLGFGWRDLPAAFVRRDLRSMTMRWSARQPMGLTGLPPAVLAAAPSDRLAWLHGRRDIEGVAAAAVWT
jgi:maleylpyruvate isomerase